MNRSVDDFTRFGKPLHSARSGAGFWGAVALVGLFLTLLSGEWAARMAANTQLEGVRQSLEIQSLALRGTVAQYRHIPFMAAQNEDIVKLLTMTGVSPIDLKDNINRYLDTVSRRTGAEALYVMDAQGLTLVSSDRDFIGDNYAFRPYFETARAGGVGLFYAVGTTFQVPGLYVAVPVLRNDEVIGVVAVKVSLRDIERSWGRAGDPVALVDERGVVFLGSQPEWIYKAVRPVSEDDRLWMVRKKQYGNQTEFALVPWETSPSNVGFQVRTTIGGRSVHFLAIDIPLPEFGWTLIVMASQKPVDLARYSAMAIAALLVLLLVATTLYWRQWARRMRDLRRMQAELENRVRSRTRDLNEAIALRKSMEDSLLVGMRACDMQGKVTYVNAAMTELTGYSVQELKAAMPPYPYWHPNDKDKDREEYERSMRGLAPRTGFESRYLHRNGHDVHTMVYTAPLRDAEGVQTGWMSSIVDITPQKLAEERQRDAEQQRREIQIEMEKTAQLARLGEVSSILVHEITQPIAAISNFESAARAFAEQGRTELFVQNMDSLKTQTQRAKQVIQRIQNWAKQRPPEVQQCGVTDIIERALNLLHNEVLRSKANVTKTADQDLPSTLVDRVQIEQVFINLISNALQAMQTVPARQRRLLIHVSHLDSGLVVRFEDSGPGVAPEMVGKLFESFSTTREEGLGLGLKICRTILETHGGRVTYERAAAGGAVFSVVLPVRT